MQRLGLLDGPLAALGPVRRAWLIGEAYGWKLLTLPLRLLGLPRRRRLTDGSR